MKNYPELTLKHGDAGANMQSWTPKTKNGRSAFGCRAIYWAVVTALNGWIQVSPFRWTVSHNNFNPGPGLEHNETWGENDFKKKDGGYIFLDEINGFNMDYIVEADFTKDGKQKTFAWGRDILSVANIETGKVNETGTILYTDVDEDEDPAPDPEPEKEPTEEMVPIRLRFTYPRWKLLLFKAKVWISRLFSVLQSQVHMRTAKVIPSHVQIEYDKKNDLSAERKGSILVPRPDIKDHGKIETFESPFLVKKSVLQEVCKKYKGTKYDWFIYPRWYLNTSSLDWITLVLPLLCLWLKLNVFWVYGIYIGFRIAAELILKALSKNRYACSEEKSSILADLGHDPGFGKNESSSPYYLRLILKAAGWKLTTEER